MSQILMVFQDGQALFRRAGHLRLAVGQEVTLFGASGELVPFTVTAAWTLLMARDDVELLELDWVDDEPSRDVLLAAGFGVTCGLHQYECSVIERLLRRLKHSDEPVEGEPCESV